MKTSRVQYLGAALLVLLAGCESASRTLAAIFPAAVQVVSGSGQQAPAGAELPAPLVARVLDAEGNPVPNWTVSWEVTNGGGSLEPGTSTTDAFGYARKRWRLGEIPGEQSVEARAATGQSVTAGTFTALALDDDEPAAVALVTVAPSPASVQTGSTVQLTATPRDAEGAPLDRPVTWSSANNAVATVSATGLVTGIAAGTVQVSATSEGETGNVTVTVTDAPPPPPAAVATVTVSPSTLNLRVGQTAQLGTTLRDAAGNVLGGRTVTWSSSNNGRATVNALGVVTAVSTGTVTITATSEGRTGTASLNITVVPVASVTVTPPTASVQVGSTTQLSATLRDSANNVLTGRSVTWSSSNTGRATVSSSGVVTGVSAGTVTITATREGQTGSATITVTAPPPAPVATVQVTPGTVNVDVGSTTQLSAVLRDAAGNTLTGRTVTWTSSNSSRATVNSSGVVTGVSAGTVTITATSEGRSGTSNVTVTTTAPPPTGSALFASEWSTATGSALTATRDGSRWDDTFCTNARGVVDVVSGSSVGFNLTNNVLRARELTENDCFKVSERMPGTVGEDYYVRAYIRNDVTRGQGQTITWHPFVIYVPQPQFVFWSNQGGGTSQYQWQIRAYHSSTGNANDHQWGQNLPISTWHRFEWHVQYINVRSSDADVRVWPRVYDMNGNLIQDANTLRRTWTSSTQTLAQWYAAGNYFRLPILSQSRTIGLGTEGPAGAANSGQPWYYAGFEVRSDTWPGPIVR